MCELLSPFGRSTIAVRPLVRSPSPLPSLPPYWHQSQRNSSGHSDAQQKDIGRKQTQFMTARRQHADEDRQRQQQGQRQTRRVIFRDSGPSKLWVPHSDCGDRSSNHNSHRDTNTCRQVHLPHATLHCLLAQCVQWHHALAQDICSFVPHENTSSLRAMSYTVQHATPTTDTSSSPSPAPRSLSLCADLRPPLERDRSPELPPPTGYETNRIVPEPFRGQPDRWRLREHALYRRRSDRWTWGSC